MMYQGVERKTKEAIRKLLLSFEDRFSKHDLDVDHTHLLEHEIDPADMPPFRCLPWGIPKAFEGDSKKTLPKLEELGFIHPNTSSWASPVCFVWKPDERVHTTIDYQLLNSHTKLEANPIPKIRDYIDALSGVAITPYWIHWLPIMKFP